jgi:hypothetical protein
MVERGCGHVVGCVDGYFDELMATLSSVSAMSATEAIAVFIDEGVMSLVTRPLHRRPSWAAFTAASIRVVDSHPVIGTSMFSWEREMGS